MQAKWKIYRPSAQFYFTECTIQNEVKRISSTHKSSLVRSRSQWIIHKETTSVLVPLSLVEFVTWEQKNTALLRRSDQMRASPHSSCNYGRIFCILLKAASVATTWKIAVLPTYPKLTTRLNHPGNVLGTHTIRVVSNTKLTTQQISVLTISSIFGNGDKSFLLIPCVESHAEESNKQFLSTNGA